MPGHIHYVRADGSVQAFVVEKIGSLRNVFPGSEGAGVAAIKGGLVIVMDVVADLAGAGTSVFGEECFQGFEAVGFGSEMAGRIHTLLRCLGVNLFHFFAVIPVEGVAVYDGGIDSFPGKNLLKGIGDGAGSSSRGTGDRHYRVCA